MVKSKSPATMAKHWTLNLWSENRKRSPKSNPIWGMGTCFNAFKGMCRLTSRPIVTPYDAHIGRVSHGAKNLNPMGNKILFFGLLEPSRTQLQELGGIMGCSLSSNITHVVKLTVQHHPSTLWYRDKLTRYHAFIFGKHLLQ